MRKKRIGIYGGTFSPPHNGHIQAASAFIKEAQLDELLITVTWISPHKEIKGVDPYVRLEMAYLAFGNLDKTTVSSYEIDKKGISYTKDTLAHFKTEENELFLLVGDDMFLTLGNWYMPEEIFSRCTVVCFPRVDDSEMLEQIAEKRREYEARFNAKIMTPAYTPYPMSSTEIRRCVKNGEDISQYVSPSVCEYIKENELYKA